MVFVNAGAQELGEGSSDCFLPAADENRLQGSNRETDRKHFGEACRKHSQDSRRKSTEERFAGMPQMKLEEHSLQNEKKEANYEKILFPAGAAGGV